MSKLKIAGVVVAIIVIITSLVARPYIAIDPDGALRVLHENGYNDVQITGYRWFKCDEKDIWQTGFVAKSQSGAKVTGTVCSGLLKGNTIRFD